ncbi:hypothetical protein WN48_00524 [Eufriesea mexicana]|nr:hypothetical protein WN48_00524 [Eufriesea mexicana]
MITMGSQLRDVFARPTPLSDGWSLAPVRRLIVDWDRDSIDFASLSGDSRLTNVGNIDCGINKLSGSAHGWPPNAVKRVTRS